MDPYVTVDSLEVKTALWLDKIAPFNQHEMKLSQHKSAFLVIDMHKFCAVSWGGGGQACV